MNHKLFKLLAILGVPVLFALLLHLVCGSDFWRGLFPLMSIAFLAGLPYGVGALTIGLSSREKVNSLTYCGFFPWIPIFVFFLLTLVLATEGWACWLMMLPVFLLLATLGGLTAGYYKRNRQDRSERIHLSLVVVLPFLLSPLEQMIGNAPGMYRAYTVININAPVEVIWAHVTRVKPIPEADDSGWLTQFLGFPRPIRAELDFEGVGASRLAVFDKGLVFHERVKAYQHGQQMTFSIKAYPHEIPSATMDEHVVIGGAYFDVLDGTYQLEKRGINQYRLHLYSHFQLTTTTSLAGGLAGLCGTFRTTFYELLSGGRKEPEQLEGKAQAEKYYDPAGYKVG